MGNFTSDSDSEASYTRVAFAGVVHPAERIGSNTSDLTNIVTFKCPRDKRNVLLTLSHSHNEQKLARFILLYLSVVAATVAAAYRR